MKKDKVKEDLNPMHETTEILRYYLKGNNNK